MPNHFHTIPFSFYSFPFISYSFPFSSINPILIHLFSVPFISNVIQKNLISKGVVNKDSGLVGALMESESDWEIKGNEMK